MNKYRTHKCNELRKEDVDKKISLSGWINKKRDHGNLLFIDLRDNYGITQCIIDKDNKYFDETERNVICLNIISLVRQGVLENDELFGYIKVSCKDKKVVLHM